MGDITTETITALQAVLGDSGSDAIAALLTRFTTALNDAGVVLDLKRQTTGNMADNFGATIQLSIRDNAAVDNPLAQITARRSGADNTGALLLLVASAGVLSTVLSSTAGTMTVYSSLIARGGTLTAGLSSNNRGQITAVHGSGGNTPGYLALYSPNGTPWYVFAEDDGTLKIAAAAPAANGDGSIIGLQF